jgi:salicylate hydroxylase
MQPQHIIIIGAGIGGMAAAAGLLRQGHRVSIHERAHTLGEIGAGIMLTPNAVRALEFIGALPLVERYAVAPDASRSRHYLTGEVMGERSVAAAYVAQFGKPMLTIHRADLHRALTETVRGIDANCIRLGSDFTGFSHDANGVEARFAGGSIERSDVLMGGDGIRSVVREAIGKASPPRFTGLVAWRGLIPVDTLPSHLATTNLTSWVSPDRHIIEYVVGSLKNYVAIARQPEWQSEGWSNPSTVAELLEAFPGWHADITETLQRTPADRIFKWALFDRDPITGWVDGRVALMGDAAHPMLPLMAQGAAMAIEDAAILSRALSVAESPQEALQRFEAARTERTAWTQLQSRSAQALYHSVERGKWLEETETRSNYLYGYDVATVAV